MAHASGAPTDKGLESKWLVLAAVMIGSIMGPLDGSIVNTVLPEITRDFKSDISIAQWVPTIYLLTISCLILLYGRLGDMVGYKKIYVYGVAGFTVTSVLCAVSQSIWMLVAFRALQGLAAGMMMAVGFAIITAAFPPAERGKALGIMAIGVAVGLAAGPTLGGVITENVTWRVIFLINLPIGISGILLSVRVLPETGRKPGQRLDLLGAFTALVFLTTLLLYANRGQDWGWASAEMIVLVITAILAGAWFVRVERRSAQPMLNLSLFTNRVFRFASLSALLNFMALYTAIFLTPFYLMFVLHYSVGKVGWIMASAPAVMLVVAPLSGVLSDRIGTRGLTFCGMVVSSVGMALMSSLNADSSSSDVVWRLALFGVGIGMFQSPNTSAAMGNVPKPYLGIASGILAAMRNVGMVLGIGVTGAVLYNVAPVAQSKPPGSFTPADIQEFLNGLHWAYISGAILAGAAAMTSLGAKGRPQQSQTEAPPGDTGNQRLQEGV